MNQDLTGVTQVLVTGQRITFERTGGDQWVATGWDAGLPVCRRPVPESQVLAVLNRYPACALRY